MNDVAVFVMLAVMTYIMCAAHNEFWLTKKILAGALFVSVLALARLLILACMALKAACGGTGNARNDAQEREK